MDIYSKKKKSVGKWLSNQVSRAVDLRNKFIATVSTILLNCDFILFCAVFCCKGFGLL